MIHVISSCSDCLFYKRPYCDLTCEDVIFWFSTDSYPDTCPLLRMTIEVKLVEKYENN